MMLQLLYSLFQLLTVARIPRNILNATRLIISADSSNEEQLPIFYEFELNQGHLEYPKCAHTNSRLCKKIFYQTDALKLLNKRIVGRPTKETYRYYTRVSPVLYLPDRVLHSPLLFPAQNFHNLKTN